MVGPPDNPAWPDAASAPPSYGELTLGFEWAALQAIHGGQGEQSDRTRHGGIVNVSFCDGHTQSIRDDIDIDVFRHICTPNDGQWSARRIQLPVPDRALDESQLR